MNTTAINPAASDVHDGPPTASAIPVGGTHSFIRRLITTLVALALAMTSVVGLTAGTASATHTTPATATVCFKHIEGGAYTETVYAQKWNGVNWQNIGSDSGTYTGCNRWNVAPGQAVKFQALYRVGSTTFLGNTGYYWIRAGGYYNFGTAYVYKHYY